MKQKRILLITTGGTIASHMTSHGLVPTLTAEDILEVLPDMGKRCQLEAKNLFRIDSTNMTPEHWKRIAGEIEAHYLQNTTALSSATGRIPWPIRRRPCPI